MKFRTFATATTTLLGAALMGYAQTQTEQRPASPPGAPATEQTSGAAGPSATPATPASPATPGGSGTRATPATPATPAKPGQTAQGTPGSPADTQAGARQRPATQARADDPDRSPAERARATREIDWADAEEAQVQLSKLPEKARNTLDSVSAGAEIDDQVARLSKDNMEVFKATLTREGQEDLHIFLQEDGTVVKTMQTVEFSEAPESVRSAISQELGGTDSEPQEFHRVIIDGKTFYHASSGGEGAQAKMIRVDATGQVQKHEDRAGAAREGQRSGLQDTPAAGRRPDNSGATPATPATPGEPGTPATPATPATPPADTDTEADD